MTTPGDPQLETVHYPRLVAEAVEIPRRYRVREEDGLLACVEAPTLRVSVERGGTVSAANLRSAPEGSIYLDGAAQGPPMVDVEAGILNLDHHESCVRPFTLSACEQALVLVVKGFDFQTRDWTIHANEPDLDTVLALWVLLNHRRLRDGAPHVLRRVIPLVRLEGAIDVHGLEHRSLAGLPPDAEADAMKDMEQIREFEVQLKERGEWFDANWIEYVRDRLGFIDRLMFRASDFLGQSEIEEVARAEVGERLAIACRSEAEIYAVEEQLREVYGERLGIILLEKAPGIYTLRQTSPFSRNSLEDIYARLNHLDPAAGNSRSPHRWGGSSDIGGSPRGVKTGLTVDDILTACREACSDPRPASLGRPLAETVALQAAAVLAAIGVGQAAATFIAPASGPLLGAVTLLLIGLALLRGVRQFLPAGWSWAWALPFAVLFAPYGAWAPSTSEQLPLRIGVVLLLAISAECLFRGWAHSRFEMLAAGHPEWRRMPMALTAVPYGLATLALALWFPDWVVPGWFGTVPLEALLPSALVSGLGLGAALGWMRTASESLLPSLVVHVVLAIVLVLV